MGHPTAAQIGLSFFHPQKTLRLSRLAIWTLFGVAFGVLPAWQLPAQDPPPSGQTTAPVDYLKQVKPLLVAKCVRCHGALRQEGDLRLDTVQFARQGGVRGPSIVAGNAEQSPLVLAVCGQGDFTQMPLESEPLTASQVALLKEWIQAGAIAADEPLPPDPKQHWSWLPIARKTPPPSDQADWALNPLDAWILQQQAAHGVFPSKDAERWVLVRRLSLDLTGLPPSPRELSAFRQDDNPDAYERQVERLLASPRHGERWARHWMDVWRYSDWDGYGAEVRNSQPHIWRWRDWIVRSLNQDQGYDHMLQMMVAADELKPLDLGELPATGFLARNWFRFNRNVWLDDTVEHTFKAFQAMTVNCARCHDHMYDPVPQTAYYQARAIFEPYEVRVDRVAGHPDIQTDGIARVYDAYLDRPTHLFIRGNDADVATESALGPGVPELLSNVPYAVAVKDLPAVAYYPGLTDFQRQEALTQSRAAVAQAESEIAPAEQALAAAEQALAAIAPPPSDASAPATGGASGDAPAASAEDATRTNQDSPSVPLSPQSLAWQDDFRTFKAEQWEQGAGQWTFDAAGAHQTQTGDTECTLSWLGEVPPDFVAAIRFRTLGGNQWKSVGLHFDLHAGTRSDGVYLSAYAGGPKVQVTHDRAGAKSFPSDGAMARPVQLNTEYQLTVAVRDRLVNVFVDSELALVYRLPEARAPGKLQLWTFDAQADLLGFALQPLAADTALAEAPSTATPTAIATKSEQQWAADIAKVKVRLATCKLAAAQAAHLSLEANLAADLARFGAGDSCHMTPAANAGELSQAAHLAGRAAKLAADERDLHAAELALLETQQKAQAGDMAAQTALMTALQTLETAKATLAGSQALQGQPAAESYNPLGPQYPAQSTGRRAALAAWLTNRQNPLTARVAVNHIWLRHFGQPLVDTMFDFGHNGKSPTHPELLDELAASLMDSGWSMKDLHRTIVNSHAYRQSSQVPTPDVRAQADPENRLLWHMNQRRLEAEAVRDCALATAGRLDSTLGGPDIDPAQGMTNYRRSLYFRHAQEKRVTFLQVFDSPSVTDCYRRNVSIVPQQALAMANSPLVQDMSRQLAAELAQKHAASLAAGDAQPFVQEAFERVLGRPASQEELETCEQFLASQMQRLQSPGQLTAFATGDMPTTAPSSDPAQRAKENLLHVLMNHHEYVTAR